MAAGAAKATNEELIERLRAAGGGLAQHLHRRAVNPQPINSAFPEREKCPFGGLVERYPLEYISITTNRRCIVRGIPPPANVKPPPLSLVSQPWIFLRRQSWKLTSTRRPLSPFCWTLVCVMTLSRLCWLAEIALNSKNTLINSGGRGCQSKSV